MAEMRSPSPSVACRASDGTRARRNQCKFMQSPANCGVKATPERDRLGPHVRSVCFGSQNSRSMRSMLALRTWLCMQLCSDPFGLRIMKTPKFEDTATIEGITLCTIEDIKSSRCCKSHARDAFPRAFGSGKAEQGGNHRVFKRRIIRDQSHFPGSVPAAPTRKSQPIDIGFPFCPDFQATSEKPGKAESHHPGLSLRNTRASQPAHSSEPRRLPFESRRDPLLGFHGL